MVKALDYVAVAASQTGAAIGRAATGVLLDHVVVTVTTAATSVVTLTDGNVDIPLVPNNQAVGVYSFPLGVRSKVATTAGWKVTTGAGLKALAIGDFT